MKANAVLANEIDQYLKQPYSRILIPEPEGGYSAEILEFPGCFSDGDSADEAMVNLEEAARSWIEASLEQGHEIPAPTGHNEYSGKIALRLPPSLHRNAVRMAARERISLNQFLMSAIAEKVGTMTFYNRLLRRLGTLLFSFVNAETRTIQRTQVRSIRSNADPRGEIEWVQADIVTRNTAIELTSPFQM